MVCCYILHSRHLLEAEKALEFYSQTRTNDKKANTLFFVGFLLEANCAVCAPAEMSYSDVIYFPAPVKL